MLRYDTRGAGLSQKVRGELSIDTMADDIAALLDALGIDGKVALAGIAVGGAIALHFAARYPERASAVVVGSPAIGIEPDRRTAALERVARIEAAGMAFAVDGLDAATAMPRSFAAMSARFERYRARWLGNDPASYATIWRMLAGMDLQGELTQPALSRARDRRQSRSRARRRRVAKPSAKAIPGARYIELRTGHYMAVQTPELIADCIGDFLKAVGA